MPNVQNNFMSNLAGPEEQGIEDLALDPALEPVNANEPASEFEEIQNTEAVMSMIELLKSEPGLAKDIATMVKTSPDKYIGLSNAAFMMVKREVDRFSGEKNEPIEPAVVLGDGGLVTSALDLVHDIAVQQGVMSEDDDDQYAAALIDLYKRVGEELLKGEGAQAARQEAQSLMMDMGSINEDGSTVEQFNRNPVAQGVEQGLLAGG
jgi:hypothetical protein